MEHNIIAGLLCKFESVVSGDNYFKTSKDISLKVLGGELALKRAYFILRKRAPKL